MVGPEEGSVPDEPSSGAHHKKPKVATWAVVGSGGSGAIAAVLAGYRFSGSPALAARLWVVDAAHRPMLD